jgi:hypothetical protein
MIRFRALLFVVPAIFACVPMTARAQYPFGKNKVLYAPKDWKILETEHVEIYFYPDERPVAEFIAGIADDTYREFSGILRVEFEKRIPVVLYGTHHDFRETNVTPYLVSESTAGFTEFMKGRIALPFSGSYPKLRHVFRHEMVHALMIEKLRVVMSSRRRWGYEGPPLWFVEGLAEYLARREPDSEAHLFMRDAVTNGLVYPLEELWRIDGSYLMYKVGESAVGYIATRFGDDALAVLLENWWRYDRFPVLVERTLGVSLRTLSDQWLAYLRRRYYPSVLDRRGMEEIGEALSPRNSLYEMHPVRADAAGAGGRVFCVGWDRGSMNILELARDGAGRPRGRTFVRAGTSGRFESVPAMRSRLYARGDTLLFVSKAGAADAVYVYDVARRRVLHAIGAPGCRVLSSPSLSPDGGSIVFSAIDGGGKSDLFVCDLAGGAVSRITDDFHDDASPDWHPTLPLIVWSSNRCEGLADSYALYATDPAGGVVEALTGGGFRDLDPRWLRDGSGVLFSSDREGTPDAYLLSGGRLARLTNALGGVYSPAPYDDETFLCAAYEAGAFRSFRIPLKRGAAGSASPDEEPCDARAWTPGSPDTAAGVVERDYRMKLGLDFIGATFALDPDYGSSGNGAQLFFTDILGNHQFIGLIGAATDDFDEILDKLNVAVTYANLSRRLNYAVGAFRLAGFTGSSYDLIRYERRTGATAAVVYPFNTFARAGISTVLRNMEREDDFTWLGLRRGSSWLLSHYLSFTFDNILWYIGGPLSGRRLSVTFGNTFDLSGNRYESRTMNVDLRHYVPLGERVVFAQRFVSRSAWGDDLQLFYLGGSWDLHGYRFRQFAGTRTWLVNSEIRFPLIDRLVMKLPIGLIEFPLLRGSLFLDAGRASGFLLDTGWIGSVGTGVELNLGYLPVARVNFSRLTDFETIERDWRIDLFLGFNF